MCAASIELWKKRRTTGAVEQNLGACLILQQQGLRRGTALQQQDLATLWHEQIVLHISVLRPLQQRDVKTSCQTRSAQENTRNAQQCMDEVPCM